MPHLSHRLTKKKRNHVDSFLVRAFQKAKKKDHVREVLTGVLTDTERTMIGKRIALIYLLSEGEGFRRICEMLEVSPSTVDRFQRQLEAGAYDSLVPLLPLAHTQRGKHGRTDSVEYVSSFLDLLDAFLGSAANTKVLKERFRERGYKL